MSQLEAYAREFERCAPWIESSLKYANDCYSIDDIRGAVLKGQMQLWPSENAALITELTIYPQRMGCIVAFAGGNLDELRRMVPVIKQWAKEKGCDFVSVHGRKGWVRALGIGRIASTIAIEEI
jgi:hypothetical protein